jgi:hypothetical protein
MIADRITGENPKSIAPTRRRGGRTQVGDRVFRVYYSLIEYKEMA